MKVNRETLLQAIENNEDSGLFTPVFDLVVKRNGEIKKSKPAIDANNQDTGYAAYVWRNVVFLVSSNPKHQCMPVCANFDMIEHGNERRELCKRLDKLVDLIVDAVPKSEWHGVHRWARAFGQ